MPAASDILQFLRGQLFQTPALPQVSFAGKTIVVTGANTGLGFECIKQLIQLNASHIILGCRNVSPGENARQRLNLEKDSTIKVEVWQVDMADFDSVKTFSARVNTELPRLDALVANAGILTNKYNVAEGFEQTLTVNVISAFLLSLLCLPKLQQSADITRTPSHLTIVGSLVHCFADHRQLQKPADETAFRILSNENEADMAARYFLSKLIVLLCVQEMAKQIPSVSAFDGPSVIFNCNNPGWCKTELFRQDDGGAFARNLLRLIGRTGEVGARTLVSAIVAGPETHGRYLSECQIKPASVWVRSQQGQTVQQQIWKELVEILERGSPGVAGVLA